MASDLNAKTHYSRFEETDLDNTSSLSLPMLHPPAPSERTLTLVNERPPLVRDHTRLKTYEHYAYALDQMKMLRPESLLESHS